VCGEEVVGAGPLPDRLDRRRAPSPRRPVRVGERRLDERDVSFAMDDAAAADELPGSAGRLLEHADSAAPLRIPREAVEQECGDRVMANGRHRESVEAGFC